MTICKGTPEKNQCAKPNPKGSPRPPEPIGEGRGDHAKNGEEYD